MSPSYLALAASLCVALPASAAAQSLQPVLEEALFQEVPGVRELRGVLTARAAEPAAANVLAQHQVLRHIPETDEYLIQVPRGVAELDLARALMATGRFEYVEPDWLVYPIACPNDPEFPNQWHHEANRMQSCEAWDIETGDPSIVVAICDTGLRVTHEDVLLHRQEGYHAPSMTWESAGGPIDDINGHGTLCTGTAAANGDNGVGVAGVGWNLGHRPIRVTDNPNGTASLSALTHAARTAADAGDKVASVSFSGGTASSVNTSGTYIRERGALLIWAAGNDSTFLLGNRENDVILVGATRSNDQRSGFSNYGPAIDLMAPGSSIRTTSRNSNSSYSNVSGTSFACPMVAGLCGLIWSRNPLLAPEEVEAILRASCEDLGPAGVDNDFGYGRINSFLALSMTPPPTVQVNFPDGRPELLDPAGGATLAFETVAGTETPVPGGAEFWVDAGAGFTLGAVTYLGGDQYEAVFPAAACPSTLRYYIEVPTVSGASFTSPLTAPSDAYLAPAEFGTVTLLDDLESTSGWVVGAPGDTANAGIWELVDPFGTTAQPTSDHSFPGTLCYVTGQQAQGGSLGSNDVDGGATTLMTPQLDLSTYSNPRVSYWRSYSNDQGGAINDDVFTVDISADDGATWVNVEVVGPLGPETSLGWRQHAFDPAALIPLTDQVRLRFIAEDSGSGSIVEAAIDDFAIEELCTACGTSFYCPAQTNSTGGSASIGFSGTPSFQANDLELTVFGCPAGENGLFIYSPDEAASPLGNGTLCVGPSTLGYIVRLGVVTTGPSGVATWPFDNGNPPTPPGQVAAGETWNFQFWYRDTQGGGALFNLSNGLRIEFCP